MSEPPCKLSLQFGGFSPNKMYVTIHAPMPKIEKKAAKSDKLSFFYRSLVAKFNSRIGSQFQESRFDDYHPTSKLEPTTKFCHAQSPSHGTLMCYFNLILVCSAVQWFLKIPVLFGSLGKLPKKVFFAVLNFVSTIKVFLLLSLFRALVRVGIL